jgi:hypothetical protein
MIVVPAFAPCAKATHQLLFGPLRGLKETSPLKASEITSTYLRSATPRGIDPEKEEAGYRECVHGKHTKFGI